MTRKKIYHAVRLVGNSDSAAKYGYDIDMENSGTRLIKTGNVLPQGCLVLQEDISIAVGINSLLEVLGNFQNTTFTITVREKDEETKDAEADDDVSSLSPSSGIQEMLEDMESNRPSSPLVEDYVPASSRLSGGNDPEDQHPQQQTEPKPGRSYSITASFRDRLATEKRIDINLAIINQEFELFTGLPAIPTSLTSKTISSMSDEELVTFKRTLVDHTTPLLKAHLTKIKIDDLRRWFATTKSDQFVKGAVGERAISQKLIFLLGYEIGKQNTIADGFYPDTITTFKRSVADLNRKLSESNQLNEKYYELAQQIANRPALPILHSLSSKLDTLAVSVNNVIMKASLMDKSKKSGAKSLKSHRSFPKGEPVGLCSRITDSDSDSEDESSTS